MRIAVPFLSLVLAGCGGSDPEATTGAPDARVETSSDTGEPSAPDSGDAGVVSDAGAVTEDTSAAIDAAPTACASGCATLSGKVMRKPLTKPQNGGKGNVYVAVFDKDPVIDRAGAKLVGKAIVENVDMTAESAAVPYTIPELTPRATPYYVVAFLDDNKNASGTAPGPDKGDLVSLDGIAAPKVTLAKAGTVTLDLALNAVLPF